MNMNCFNSNQDKNHQNLVYLIGKQKKLCVDDANYYHLSLLCISNENADNKESTKEVRKANDLTTTNQCTEVNKYTADMSAHEVHTCADVVHICSHSGADTCGCELYKPNIKLPHKLYQQGYNRWKAMMDLGFVFSKIRKKKVIYIQALENLPEFVTTFNYHTNGVTKTGFISFLQDFLSLYFLGFDVRVLDCKTVEDYGWDVKRRVHTKTGEEQLLVTDLCRNIKKVVPFDGYCMLGITWTDLYPVEDLNFVLGLASSAHSSAVFSFGRFEPKAFKDGGRPPAVTEINGKLIWRMIKVISHETCHLFLLSHCVFFHCAMNASYSLTSALSQPLFLCPVCMSKIQKVCKFKLLERYECLHDFLSEIHSQYPCDELYASVQWLKKCIHFLGQKPTCDEILQ